MVTRIYESRFPGEQDAPVGFWNNPWTGTIQNPTIHDYLVVGQLGGVLWLQSKTGDKSDSIQINFNVDPSTFDHIFRNKRMSFRGQLVRDYTNEGWYYQWESITNS